MWAKRSASGEAVASVIVTRRSLAVVAALLLASPALAALPRVQGRAYVVENGTNGDVLLRYNLRQRVPIASITKLMTVLVTLERARVKDTVTVAQAAAAVGESTVNLRAGERISVGDLIEAALVQSANDAADALAYHVGRGDVGRFVAMMNLRARQLGLSDSHFVRPDGLDAPGHVSSARDVTVLARRLMRFPLIRQIVRQQRATIAGGRTLHTWNDLLSSFPGTFGVKTGHTNAAGWSEVAAARRGGVTIYATLLGSPTRAVRNAGLVALLNWGFSRYRAFPAVVRGRVYARVQTEYGKAPIPLVAARPLVVNARVDHPVVRRIVSAAAVSLPVEQGRVLGQIRVFQDGRLLGRRLLVAARTVSRPGVGGRVVWYAGRTAHHVSDWIPG
jgi:serine-type D-Ala-D-Ala carboxypeptidase (penicillin-binding protein 5/6)